MAIGRPKRDRQDTSLIELGVNPTSRLVEMCRVQDRTLHEKSEKSKFFTQAFQNRLSIKPLHLLLTSLSCG